MKSSMLIFAAAGSILVAACGGSGDDTLGDQASEAAEAKADTIDQAAGNASGATEDSLEAQADAVRESGEAREEAIDDADVEADEMSASEKEALVNGQ